MNDFILKAKHWQVFLLFSAGYVISNNSFSPIAGGCLFLILLVAYVGWYVLLGSSLRNYLPRNIYYSFTWLFFDGIFVIVSYASVLIFFDGNLQVNGLAAIPGFYLFFAIIHLFWFSAAALVAIETREEPKPIRLIANILLLIFWPIGVWFIQPRLNHIYHERNLVV